MEASAASHFLCFGQVVRRRRTALGLSQEELADRGGLHRNYIERGERNVGIKAVFALAAGLQCSAADLFP